MSSTQSVSFSKQDKDLYNYIRQLAQDKHGGNISYVVLDAIRCHQKATEIYGDWRQMESPPGWARELLGE